MKTILIALTIAGFVTTSAQGQTQTDATAKPAGTTSGKTAKTNDYQVCKEMGGYYTCCTHHDKLAHQKKKHAAGHQTLVASRPKIAATTSAPLAANAGTAKPVHHVKHAKRPQQLSAAKVESSTGSCRPVAYKVFEIMADRKNVMSYETTDLQNLTPMNDERTYYGPTGPMPDEVPKQGIKTIVINSGQKQANHCERDEKNKSTACYHNGGRLVRDANGYYSYGE